MQHALDSLVSLRLVGTRLMEHAPVYKTMGLYDGNTVLTGLAVNGTDYVVVNVVIWMRGVFGDDCEMASLYLSKNMFEYH